MLNQIPFELISNVASIILLVILGYRFLQYKKKVDIIKGLDELKKESKLTQEDIEFINQNEYEYKHKIINAEASMKLAKPIFILIAGVLILFFSFQEAMIHLNVVVVAFIFMVVDKMHKKNLYTYLYSLKKEIKAEQKEEA